MLHCNIYPHIKSFDSITRSHTTAPPWSTPPLASRIRLAAQGLPDLSAKSVTELARPLLREAAEAASVTKCSMAPEGVFEA
jgi:hypothetical protein